MKIGLFYGSDTGRTTAVAERIKEILGPKVDIEDHDVVDFKKTDMDPYDYLIIGLSTWYDGELQSDWEVNFDEFSEVDFKGKIIALYGLGDQIVYCDYFIDGVGILGEQILKNDGKLIGKWPTEGYLHTESKAEMEDGFFCGLALDEDTEEEMTEDRLTTWCDQILDEFTAIHDQAEGAGSVQANSNVSNTI